MEKTFWKDNKLDKEHQVSIEQIIKDFLKSESYSNFKNGWPFERAMLLHLSSYGAFDPITNIEWDELHKEFQEERNEK